MPDSNIEGNTTKLRDGSDGDEDELVAGGIVGVGDDDGSSVFGVEDDEADMWRAPAAGVEREPVMDVGVSAEVSEVLEASAETAQRLLVSSLRRMYVRGRAYIDVAVQQQPITGQRRVALSSYFHVTDYKAEELIAKLRQGRVITRLSAAPGVGKTTRVCAEIATKCQLRVCQVELNAHVASSASVRQKSVYNLRGSNRRFPREEGAYLTCMTYDDFRAYVCSASRKRLFADFDVFYFDEAHTPVSSVYLALQYFAVYAQQHNSLIVASATVSTDESNNVASKRVGDFKVVDMGFRKGIESGKLFSEYMRDRTMLLLPSDAEVWYAKAVYAEQGVDVQVLDSASSVKDVDAVMSWMLPEAITPRVLIATFDYGVGYNFPTSYVVSTASKVVYDWNDRAEVVERVVALTERDVTQHKSRTGRGITVGSGGIILSSSRAPEEELSHSERVRAYVGLVAASIKPLPAQWADVAALFPQGLTRDVAGRILSIPLPPVLVIRYLGSDGNVAAFFAQAMNIFAEPDHYVVPSRDVYPIGFDDWRFEKYGGYFEGDESTCDVDARVPFSAPQSLRVYMHALYAIATRRISVARWRPDSMDDDVSGSEDEAPRFKPKSRVVLPRLVMDFERRSSPEPPPVPSKWSFDVPEDQQAKRKRRVGKDWASSPKGEASIAELRRAVEGTSVIGVVTANVVASEDTKLVEVRSPGGTITVKLSDMLYRQLISGNPLDPKRFLALLEHAKSRDTRIVDSGLFANWGPPWTAVLTSCMETDVLEAVMLRGMVDVMVGFVKRLYDRFRAEVVEVCKTSHVYGSWFERFVNKAPSVTRLVREIKSGKFSIAQSDSFIKRVLEIKQNHDEAVLGFEEHGFYVPEQVTSAQRRLPLRDRNRNMRVLDDDVHEQPFNNTKGGHFRSFLR